MRTYHANEIGNVAVLGHSGCGKTSILKQWHIAAASLIEPEVLAKAIL